MDKNDQKILYELDKNARSSYSQIAKATSISQETVRYRVNSLIKEKIIQKFLTILNTTKLGNSYYQIMLKLQNIDEERKNKIMEFLDKNSKVAWIGNLEGNYDIAFILYVKNQIELQSLIEELYSKFMKYIMRKTISVNLYAEFFTRDYLVNKERLIAIGASYKSYEKSISLNKIDSQICSYLGENARITSVELAEKIGISPDAILQRIKKLRKEEIILGYNIVLNQDKMHQLHYKILLHLNNLSKEKEQKLLSFSRVNNRVIAIIKTLAEWDYEIDLEVEDVNQVKKFTMDLTNHFSEIIRDYNLIRVVNMPKYTFYPS